MKTHRRPFQIKLGLFLLGIVIVIAVIWSNWLLIGEIRRDARKQVEYLARAYSDAINQSEGNDIQYVLEYLLPSINFPIIITNPDEIYAWKNLAVDEGVDPSALKAELRRISVRMDESFDPLPVIWQGMEIGKIHFGDPDIVTHLRWLPYYEVGGVLLFVLFGFLGFQLIRKSERDYIWAGMARETAHQLGTPISSLLGWKKLLEEEEPSEMILGGMEQDLDRLSAISDRFHKIGSKPQMKPVDVKALCTEICEYMQKRVSNRSGIRINTIGDPVTVTAERTLLSWAIENLIKNAIDACRTTEGKIDVRISSQAGEVHVDVIDSGIGINRKDFRNIFRPGVSTKKRGWGLGLSLTSRIIEDIHQGRLRLLKSKPGETIFRITLKNS